MATALSNFDNERVSVNHGNIENGESVVQRRDVVAEGNLIDINSIPRKDLYDLRSGKNSRSKRFKFMSRCSISCFWVSFATLIFLMISTVGFIKFVELSNEMNELREQFTVSYECSKKSHSGLFSQMLFYYRILQEAPFLLKHKPCFELSC